MTVYGDLEVSALRELPAGRSTVATTVVPAGEKPAWLDRVWERVREEVAAGQQGYVVCPRIGAATPARRDGARPDDPDSRPRRQPDAGATDGSGAAPAARGAQVAPMLADGPLAGLRLGGAARPVALRGEGRRDARVRRRRDRRAGRHHGHRGRGRRAQRHRDGDHGGRPVRPLPAAPAARAGRAAGPRPGCACWSPTCRRAPPPGPGWTRWPRPPTGSSSPGWISSCAERATCWARSSPGAGPGCGCCRCSATRMIIAKAAGQASGDRRRRPRPGPAPGSGRAGRREVGDEDAGGVPARRSDPGEPVPRSCRTVVLGVARRAGIPLHQEFQRCASALP